MISEKLWNLVQGNLFDIPSTNELFNQYRDYDLRVDRRNAQRIRRENLKAYFDCFSKRPSVLLVGEAAGPWGCRFSGVPFTGEAQLISDDFPFAGERSSKRKPDIQTEKHPPYVSQSAEIFWDVMLPYHPKFLVWDCVPFHPHDENDIMTVRTPRVAEIDNFSGLLKGILDIVRPRQVIALGRKAERALIQIGVEYEYVRHPAHGGREEFTEGIERLLHEI